MIMFDDIIAAKVTTDPTWHDTRGSLNSIMEFDHVITVATDGSVGDGPVGVGAPTLLDGELDGERWSLLNGWSSQQGYRGPVMHASESIGGRMAEHILATPGVYVAIVADYTCDEHDGECQCDGIDGWAVAYLKGSGS